jgi:hypothetical protein
MSNRVGAALPPFAELFDDPRPGAWCRAHELMTPRNAAALWAAAIHLADVLDEDLSDVIAANPVTHTEWTRLPWVVHVDCEGVEWCGQFLDSLVTLVDDLAAGRCPVPRSTAEEVALQMVMEDIVENPDDAFADRIIDTCRSLPARNQDNAWDDLALALFPYPKIRRLIAEGVHGITDDYELVAETGLVRLAVSNWFDSFDGCVPTRPLPACACKDLT